MKFAIAQVLLALVSGVSVMLFEQTGSSGKLFKDFMNEIYWPIDPPEGIDFNDASELLYDEFRNPLAHVLGIAVEVDRKTMTRTVTRRARRLVVKKYESLSEQKLELREVSVSRPKMSATLRLERETATLLVDGLYWGLRRAIQKLATDEMRMQQAEAFLSASPS